MPVCRRPSCACQLRRSPGSAAKVIGWPLLTVRPKDGPMNEQPSILPPSPEEAERLALEAAVAEARADPRPGILHEDVRREMRASWRPFPSKMNVRSSKPLWKQRGRTCGTAALLRMNSHGNGCCASLKASWTRLALRPSDLERRVGDSALADIEQIVAYLKPLNPVAAQQIARAGCLPLAMASSLSRIEGISGWSLAHASW